MSVPESAAIACGDWGKHSGKRAVHVADIPARAVRRMNRGTWSFNTVDDTPYKAGTELPVLVAFDAPRGVPRSYFDAVSRECGLGTRFRAEFPHLFQADR